MKKVLITNTVPSDLLKPLNGLAKIIQGPDNGHLMSREEVLSLAPELNAIINQAELRVDDELLQIAPHLQIVANVAIGYNNLDVDAMTEHNVWATNVPNAFTDSTADCTMALILGLARNIHNTDRYTRSGQWQSDGFQPGVWDGILLSNKTLGIVGYGNIGKAVAKRASAFGMKIIFNNRTDIDDENYRELDELLREADFISLHTPLTPETHHLVNESRLRIMKSEAILINMARGPVVDEQALVDALRSGRLYGAALDVFEEEPRVHPALLDMPNVLLTPHIGGGTNESRSQARQLCIDNVAAVLRGASPLTPINNLKG
jgi:glyoxylate reductase